MSTLENKYDSIEKIIFDEGIRIKSLDFNPDFKNMNIHLSNNIVFVISLSFYKALKNAKPTSLKKFSFIANGTGIHWPDLDEDLSLKGFFKDFLKQKVKSGEELVIA